MMNVVIRGKKGSYITGGQHYCTKKVSVMVYSVETTKREKMCALILYILLKLLQQGKCTYSAVETTRKGKNMCIIFI